MMQANLLNSCKISGLDRKNHFLQEEKNFSPHYQGLFKSSGVYI